MGSVNATTTPALPAAPAATTDETLPEANWFNQITSSLASTSRDVGHYTGVVKVTDDGPELEPIPALTIAAGGAGVAGLQSLASRVTDPRLPSITRGEAFVGAMSKNLFTVTPTLVSAVAGPAIADGVTMIAPNLVPAFKDTKDIKDAVEKKAQEKKNENVKIARFVAGAAAVGIAAGIAFIVKPDLFKKFGVNFMSDEAIQGATHYMTSTGTRGVMPGVLDQPQVMQMLGRAGRELLDGETVEIVKTISPMARDAVFSNRVLLGAIGGVATLKLADTAAGAEGDDKLKWGAAAAAAGVVTLGGIAAMGSIVPKVGMLQGNQMFWKPNVEWIKSYATKIAPITAVPGGTAASQYFNVVNDFNKIVDAKSPFRK